MDLSVQWFFHILEEAEILSKQHVSRLYDKLGNDKNLSEYAQSALDLKAQELNRSDAEALVDTLQKAMHTAVDRASNNIHIPEEPKSNIKFDFNILPNLSDSEIKAFMEKLLRSLRNSNVSDIHLSAKSYPFVRKALKIIRISNYLLTEEDAVKLNTVFLTEDQKKKLNKDLTFSHCISMSNGDRYRVTLFTHKDGLSGTYHVIPNRIRALEDLHFTTNNIETINSMLTYHNGLILVTGPMGSGKTTTLASIINILNKKRNDHIVIVENPIEIIQTSSNCNITQREVFVHTKSYANAVKAALIEDPDIIVIGELNDLETIEIAITASETGHLVIGTLQTSDAVNTINRIINIFPPFQQPQIRAMIAGSLRGIICQTLLSDKNGNSVLACEILVNNLAVSNTINEGKFHLLKPIIETASKAGMSTMDESIYNLYTKDRITKETAVDNIQNIKQYTFK
ncbi:MAG TPA: PilT/PilU family type 4a pilus ATPase [Victivallales bacterium]|nr:PilT/PilU family type 4a pilus ATPase [Victivallales bacterium]